MPTTQTKEHAHKLIERLAPNQVAAVVGLLEAMLDPVSRATAHAPLDDEPLTAEEEKALAEAQEWLKHNQPIPHEQVLDEFGITEEEIDRSKEPDVKRIGWTDPPKARVRLWTRPPPCATQKPARKFLTTT